MITKSLFAAAAALLVTVPLLASADAVERPEGADVPALPMPDPMLAGPLTGAYAGGPALAFLIPAGQPTGPALPAAGLLYARGSGLPDWEIHAEGLVFKCTTQFNRGSIYVGTPGNVQLSSIAANKPCTGRFDDLGLFVVSMSEHSYAGVKLRMGGLMTAAPMLI